MKFATTMLLAATASVASAASVRATAGLLSKARRLEDAEQQQDEGDEYSFLSGYSAHLIGCAAGEIYKSNNGDSEYASVIFRLCPADSCDADSAVGCKNGYGDYVIGINSFVQAYVEQNKDNMQGDDANDMNPDQYAECRQIDYQPEDDGAEAVAYYVGPACAGTTGLKLELFSDETCSTAADGVSYADISGGATLPYSNGKLASTKCQACSVTDEDGNTEISDLCMNTYMYSGHCESKMQKNSQYSSNDESACEYITSITKKSSTGGNAGAAIGWVIFALVIVAAGGYGYSKWWMHKKNSQSEGVIMS
ncbi:hypothetical protein MPSEU_001012900 [Mayamaea pseudoterrestris]|nr:hypothetical protein MPSEU_001012900 [Mayamaea pseudoterrestris]